MVLTRIYILQSHYWITRGYFMFIVLKIHLTKKKLYDLSWINKWHQMFKIVVCTLILLTLDESSMIWDLQLDTFSNYQHRLSINKIQSLFTWCSHAISRGEPRRRHSARLVNVIGCVVKTRHKMASETNVPSSSSPPARSPRDTF